MEHGCAHRPGFVRGRASGEEHAKNRGEVSPECFTWNAQLPDSPHRRETELPSSRSANVGQSSRSGVPSNRRLPTYRCSTWNDVEQEGASRAGSRRLATHGPQRNIGTFHVERRAPGFTFHVEHTIATCLFHVEHIRQRRVHKIQLRLSQNPSIVGRPTVSTASRPIDSN